MSWCVQVFSLRLKDIIIWNSCSQSTACDFTPWRIEWKWCQNTVESLEKTAQLKPDLIEMDIQETKDGQFVMMHDANLKGLAGINKTPGFDLRRVKAD